MFKYLTHGVVISSELRLFSLKDNCCGGSGKPELEIKFDSMPSEGVEPRDCGLSFQVAPGECRIQLEGTANYLIANGRRILVEPAKHSLASDIEVFLLGSVVGVALHQRGCFVLQGAASIFKEKEGAVLFIGQSGAGTSSIMGALVSRGHMMVTDNFATLHLSGQSNPSIAPSSPSIRLWEDSAQKILGTLDGLRQVRSGLRRYDWHVGDRFYSKASHIRHIYHLVPYAGSEIVFEELSSIEGFHTLLSQVYQRTLIHGLGLSTQVFHAAACIAKATRVIRVYRPIDRFHLDELADAIEAQST